MGLPQLIKRLRTDLVVLNGENADEGFGLTESLARQFFSLGVHVITTGNHIWQREEILPFLDKDQRILRPANYPSQVPGHGHTLVTVGGLDVAVVNLQGRHQMVPIDCPFQTGAAIVDKLRKKTKVVLIDFHAESAQEKEALALHLDGKVSVVVGTHTHVQTADEKILPKGTGYITDLGLSGPLGGVIGSDPNIAIERQLTQIPLRNQILDAPSYLQGVVCTIDPDSGKALSIKRISEQYGV
jgi:metallophosphoesterase (TIGR00282 family)